MHVDWLEQSAADIPPGNDWLASAEAARLDGFRFEKRRNEWRLGRWTAKRAVAASLQREGLTYGLRELEIRVASSGAPEVYCAGLRAPVEISIRHSAGTAACAVASRHASLGCDLEVIEPRSDAYIADYFTDEERALIAHCREADRWWLVTLLWSAKESALKALHAGLRLDTRSVALCQMDTPKSPSLSCWLALQVRTAAGQVYSGWWRCAGRFVRTFVALPVPAHPFDLAELSWMGTPHSKPY
jgi:4'-phosphopantetheinyl transferase